MNEAARSFPVGFVEATQLTHLSTENERLIAQNECLGNAANRFTDSFAGIVSTFLDDIKGTVGTTENDAVSFDHFGTNLSGGKTISPAS